MALQIRSRSESQVDSGHLGLWTGFFFTINTIIGAGFLSIPWAFDKGGWLFGVIFLSFSAVQSYSISSMLLDIMSKVEVLIRLRSEGFHIKHFSMKDYFKNHESRLLAKTAGYDPIITSRRLDITECVRVIFGNKIALVYLFVLFIYLEGTLLAYASIFSSSFTSTIPIGSLSVCDVYDYSGFYNDCKWKYWIWLLFYSVFMVMFVLRGLEEQKWLQSVMSLMRFAVIGTVIICCLVNATTNSYNQNSDYNSVEWPPKFNFEHTGEAMPIIVFALMYQQNLPTFAAHIRNKKRNLPRIAFMALVVCATLYMMLGLIVPLGMKDVPSMVSLDFRNYSAGHDLDNRPDWTYVIEYLVIVFPAIDVFSSFPLVGLALSDNLITIIFGNDPDCRPPTWGVSLVRLLACLPPLVIAFLVYDLGFILDWVGLLAFAISVSVPLMEIAVSRMVPQDSHYKTPFGHPVMLI